MDKPRTLHCWNCKADFYAPISANPAAQAVHDTCPAPGCGATGEPIAPKAPGKRLKSKSKAKSEPAA